MTDFQDCRIQQLSLTEFSLGDTLADKPSLGIKSLKYSSE